MSKYPEIFVLRHGQTEWNHEGRHQGRLNSNLTDLGRVQANRQGEILQSILGERTDVTALTSPQGRAFDTAQLALAPVGLTATQDERLCEISFGAWEGLTFDEIAADWPEKVQHSETNVFDWHFQSPGGESFDAVHARASDLLDALTGPTVIVTHGITSRVMRGVWLGLEWDETATLPGGQGCVYHLDHTGHNKLE